MNCKHDTDSDAMISSNVCVIECYFQILTVCNESESGDGYKLLKNLNKLFNSQIFINY